MDASEIKDDETLGEWLKTRSESDCIAIVLRHALRKAPLLYDSTGWNTKFDLTALAVLRVYQTLSVLCKRPTPDVKLAAHACVEGVGKALRWASSAYDADTDGIRNDEVAMMADRIDSVTLPALGAVHLAHTAALAATSSSAARFLATNLSIGRFTAEFNTAANLESIRPDAIALGTGADLLNLPLWHNETRTDLLRKADSMHTYWQTSIPAHWDFWQRWYDAAVAGRPLDWQLQHDIALIPDEIWQSGPGPVAEAIARIEAAHSAKAAQQPETDPPSGTSERPRSTRFILAQITLLHDLIEEEYEYLRGHNGGTVAEQPLLDQQRATLQKLRDLVNAMLMTLDGDPSASTALTVVNETLPVVVTEAEALIDQGAPPEVSARITSLAASIKVLTASGTPGTLATALAFSDMAMTNLKTALKRRKKP